MIMDFNPKEIEESELTLWMWGNDWISQLEWDPKDWQWRRIGMLAETTILNYCTKRGYRVALQQNTTAMKVDAELEAAGYNSKIRKKKFQPYLASLSTSQGVCHAMAYTHGRAPGRSLERESRPTYTLSIMSTTIQRNATTRVSRLSGNLKSMDTL